MRELQPNNLNVELLRRFGISHREMRFVQVHGTSLHPLHVRAQIRASRRQRGGLAFRHSDLSAHGGELTILLRSTFAFTRPSRSVPQRFNSR